MELSMCQLCEREVEQLTKHHLIPKQKFNKKWKRIYKHIPKSERTIEVCIPCSKQIHALFTNRELANNYNTIEELKSTEQIQKWLVWVRQHNPSDIKYCGAVEW